MNIQDYLNRYKNKPMNLVITNMELQCNSHTIAITATSGFGLEVKIAIPTDTDLDNLCLRHGYKYYDKDIVEKGTNE
jgi:hypothetical protein